MASIQLIEGKSSKADMYWHVYCDQNRAGYVTISHTKDKIWGEHDSISIFINKKDQGQGIGSVAYGMACKASGLAKIYAHMRKTNIASEKAALKAGFKKIENPLGKQLSLVWNR